MLQAVGSEILKTIELALGFELAVMVPPWSAMILRQMARPRPVPSVPLPLPQVQKFAGHKDISTTMRYVHSHGIEQTTSMQWSREQRRGLNEPLLADKVLSLPTSHNVSQKVETPKTAVTPFRVISGGRV